MMAATRHMEHADRERLIRAATDAFAAQGYERASLNAIIREAGLSKGAFYYHFEGKQALFLEVVGAGLGPVIAAAGRPEPASTKQGYWASVDAYFDRAYTALVAHDDALPLLRAANAVAADPSWREAYADVRRRFLDAILEVAAQGQRLGAVRDDLPDRLLAGLLLAIFETLDQWALEEGWTQDAAAWAALAGDLARRMAAPEAAP